MNLDGIIIRDAVVGDIEALVRLLEQLFSIEKDFVYNYEKQKKGLLLMLDGCGKHRAIKVAQHHKTVVGMCSVQTRISTAQGNISAIVEDLVVQDAFKNSGIGTKLLTAVYDWADKRGIQSLQLLADKENDPALNFYSTQGWKKTNLHCYVKSL